MLKEEPEEAEGLHALLGGDRGVAGGAAAAASGRRFKQRKTRDCYATRGHTASWSLGYMLGRVDFMVFLVSLLIACSYANTWLCVFLPWLWYTSPGGLCAVAMVTVFTSLTARHYARAIFIDAGGVPKGWLPLGLQGLDRDAIRKTVAAYIKNVTNAKAHEKQRFKQEWKYCTRCDAFKPDRAHHCSECGRCVLMLDHHCPWINNDVGFYNHKDFVLFLLYASIGCSMVVFLQGWRAIAWLVELADDSGVAEESFGWEGLQAVCLLFNILILAPVTMGIWNLLFYQLHVLSQGCGTIDEWQRDKARFNARLAKQSYHWPYDHGSWQANLKAFFGPHWSMWLRPTWHRGDGLTHPVVNGPKAKASLLPVEPEADKFV